MNAPKRSGKQNISTFVKLTNYLKKYRVALFFAVILTISYNVLSLMAPKVIESAISLIEVEEVDLQKVFSFCGFMLIFYISSYILRVLLSLSMMKFGQNIGYSLRKDAFDKFEKLPLKYFDTNQTGDIISRFTYDIDTVSSSIGQSFINFVTSMFTLIGSLFMMTGTNMELMLSFFITIPISIGLGFVWTMKVRSFHREKSKKMGELNGYIEDKITGYKTVRIYGQQNNILEKLKIKNNEWAKAHFKSEFMGGGVLRSGLLFVTNITTSLLYVHSCILFLDSKITLAEVSSFILYAKMFTGILNELTFIIADLQTSLAAADRVFDFMEQKEEKPDNVDAINLEKPVGKVSLKNVSFSYDKNREILKDLNLEVEEGKVVAIVGHTGAGKTTLINLLMRFYHPTSGEITLDNINIENLTQKSLRSSCAMVLQDAWLFGGTIFDNIVYGRENTTLDEVIDICKKISLHEYILTLDKGYDTLITENTVNISQGQKQLITIARAMLLDAKILILDEATSNVDTLTELSIQNSMKTLMKDKTSFVIAHRLSTVRNADIILVMDQGQIIERGSHEQLLNVKDGTYSKLYNSQFEEIDNFKKVMI
ncbi:MAG: ABC transporter ATP-binding protein [Peptostreptococcaceae bacterium]